MMDSNPVKTPMMNNLQLPVLTQPEVDVMEYQRSIGSLMYLIVCMYPDITYAMGVLSCHVAYPGRVHLTAIKHIFCYLRGTSQYKLNFKAQNVENSPPIVFVNSDWAGDKADRKSMLGYVILIDGGGISWGSKKQTSIALSTIEAEFIAALTAVKEII